MGATLLNIPVEVQVAIFKHLPDLDEASCLSQTCRVLRTVFTTTKKSIESYIIANSDTHKYDRCLSQLIHAFAPAEESLRKNLDYIPKEALLDGRLCLNCFDTDFSTIPLTDADVDEIRVRWQKMRFLRHLYVNKAAARSFKLFRLTAASARTRLGVRCVTPRLTLGSSWNSVENTTAGKFTYDFKARFYKALCLNAIALMTLKHATFSRDQPEPEDEDPNPIGDDLERTTQELWVKKAIVLNGCRVKLSDQTRLECIEAFEFLYYFLLRKVIPTEAVANKDFRFHAESSNTRARAIPVFKQYSPALHDRWTWLLRTCRCILLPSDVADLVKHKSWKAGSKYPLHTVIQMRERNVYNNNAGVVQDYETHFTRLSMVYGLRHTFPSWVVRDVRVQAVCWWDIVRLKLGSPFESGSQHRFHREVKEMTDAIIEEQLGYSRLTNVHGMVGWDY